MIMRNLDINGDIVFGNGIQDYLTTQNAIALNIKTRLLSFLNNCVWDMTSGIDWFTYLRQPGYQVQITLAVKRVILQSYGVIKINSASVSITGRSISLAYNINTIYTSNFIAELVNLENVIFNKQG
jgi:hypothetical protein